nr:MAG TPA: hypothetical protein [Caudoviricetes sp.]
MLNCQLYILRRKKGYKKYEQERRKSITESW